MTIISAKDKFFDTLETIANGWDCEVVTEEHVSGSFTVYLMRGWYTVFGFRIRFDNLYFKIGFGDTGDERYKEMDRVGAIRYDDGERIMDKFAHIQNRLQLWSEYREQVDQGVLE